MLLLSKQLAADVRPEFLHNVEAGVQTELLAPLVCGMSQRPVSCGIVKVGNASRNAVPHNLGSIERIPAVVILSDDFAADGITRSLEESTLAFREIAWILPKSDGQYSLGKHVPDRLVGECAAIVFADC